MNINLLIPVLVNSQPDISIVVPIFNEEKILPELYDRLTKSAMAVSSNYELVFVNDGSKDSSFEHIKKIAQQDNKVKFIGFSRNFGHQVAVTAGLQHTTGKAVVIIDGDLQDPPELIKDLHEKMKEGFEVVYAKRRSRQGESFMKKFTAKLFYRLLSKITSVDIPVDTGDFRIVSRKIVDVLNKMPEQHKFLRGQISWVGFSQTYLEYNRSERIAGKSGYTYRKMIRFAMDGITSFSSFPLKVASLAGFVVSFIAFLLILYSLYGLYVLKTNLPGWTSLMLSVLFIGGIQLFCIGIIGEYIGRISSEIRNRPLYVINETNISLIPGQNNG